MCIIITENRKRGERQIPLASNCSHQLFILIPSDGNKIFIQEDTVRTTKTMVISLPLYETGNILLVKLFFTT